MPVLAESSRWTKSSIEEGLTRSAPSARARAQSSREYERAATRADAENPAALEEMRLWESTLESTSQQPTRRATPVTGRAVDPRSRRPVAERARVHAELTRRLRPPTPRSRASRLRLGS